MRSHQQATACLPVTIGREVTQEIFAGRHTHSSIAIFFKKTFLYDFLYWPTKLSNWRAARFQMRNRLSADSNFAPTFVP